MSSRVTVHSVLTAVSSKPVGSGVTQPLSALDHAMGLHSLHLIFYYDQNLFGSFDLDPLRESLSEVLSLYPMVTGRLARGSHGNWEIRCNDAGVRVIKATVDTTLDEWLTSAHGSEETHLTAWHDLPDDFQTWSPFQIQINEFQGGGVAIGLSCAHLLADVTWASSFFKSWAHHHRHLPITPPSLNPSTSPSLAPSHPPPPPFYAAKSSTKPLTFSPKLATATFKFSASSINESLSHLHPNATPFDFLAALFWTRISRFKPPTNHHAHHSLSICFDFRSLLKSPLPTGYMGNAFHFSLLSLDVKRMQSSQLGDIAALVHTHLEGIGEDEIWSAIRWLESQGQLQGDMFRAPTCMYGPELTCVRMDHMMVNGPYTTQESLMYEAIFREQEKPVHVSCHVGNVQGKGLVMVMPSPEGGLARAVTLMLPEEELEVLCKDQAILQLQPTMVLSGPGTPLFH